LPSKLPCLSSHRWRHLPKSEPVGVESSCVDLGDWSSGHQEKSTLPRGMAFEKKKKFVPSVIVVCCILTSRYSKKRCTVTPRYNRAALVTPHTRLFSKIRKLELRTSTKHCAQQKNIIRVVFSHFSPNRIRSIQNDCCSKASSTQGGADLFPSDHSNCWSIARTKTVRTKRSTGLNSASTGDHLQHLHASGRALHYLCHLYVLHCTC